MTTNPTMGDRDLILGVTNGTGTGFPGMVALSKGLPGGGAPGTFSPADFYGSWRVYVQRVSAKGSGSTTQVGQLTFTNLGAFVSGSLTDAANASTSFMAAPAS